MSDMAFTSDIGKGSQMETLLARQRAVRLWLGLVALLVLAMVLVGGATRLTDSGLSITEWKPVAGVVPPLSLADWDTEFEKYRQIPEYQFVNRGMSLEAFKTIYWWEWGHRFLGRVTGLAFFVPFAIFWALGWLTSRMKWQGSALLLLGGLQGVIGWYMVMSGLVDRTDVSQYRLALHLAMAALIFAAVLLMIADVGRNGTAAGGNHGGRLLRATAALAAGLIFIQIGLGALVAGLDAGLTYATWPLMDGNFFPDDLLFLDPWYRNMFENVLTVQFDHRLLAYILVLVVVAHAVHAWKSNADGPVLRRAFMLAGLVSIQAGLGIATLLSLVRVDLALAHQGLAFAVFGFATLHAFACYQGAKTAP